MNLIKNLSIKNKLLLIAFPPLVALVYFFSVQLNTDLKARNTVKKVYSEVLVAEKLSQIIHQLQHERGFSLEFIFESNSSNKNLLFGQRIQTDRSIQELNEVLATYEDSSNLKLAEELASIRHIVHSSNANPDAVQADFSALNLYLIDQVNNTSNLSRNPQVKSLLSAHTDLMYGKEYLGQLRSEMNQNIKAGGFSKSEHPHFSSIKGKYEMNLENFLKNSSPKMSAFFRQELENASIYKAKKIIDAAFQDPKLENFPFTAEDWWANGTTFLNSLKTVEDYSTAAVINTAEEQLATVTKSINRSIILAIAMVLLLFFFLYRTITTLVNAIKTIQKSADRIAKGDLDFSVDVNSRDEIGSLAASFNQMMGVTREYAETAESIGSGNYSRGIKIRSEEDILGISLNNMKANLQKLSEENQTRTWLLTGNSELNHTIRGEKELRVLASEIIHFLASYLEAKIGAIYLVEKGALHLYGSYAFNLRKGNNNIINFGEGLVGQAALEKDPIVFSDIPENYLTISSSIGNSGPKNIIVFPFFCEEQLKGVVELGSTKEFSKVDLQLLKLVGENIGIAFNSNQSRSHLQELLEETQRQTEELEAQQEELRQANEELQVKTTMLEESELKLRAQQEELQQTNEELEEKAHLLTEQKDKLHIAKIEVEAKASELEITSKYKSEFLANMSHELRTPLNSILILAELLADNKSQVLGEKEIEFAKNIHSSGGDLLNLINEILDLSKVESGNIELDFEEVIIEDVIHKVDSLFREMARNLSTEFELNYNKEEIKNPVVTDKLRLEQILRNLLSNAFKFTGQNGRVAMDVSITPTRGIKFKSNKFNDQPYVLAFAVRDNGIGIAENKQTIIFEAFQQADGSTKRKYGGTGLGLSISREIAQKLGGEIHLESEVGKGSTFTFYLPLHTEKLEVIPAYHEIQVEEIIEASLAEVQEEETSLEMHVNDDRNNIKTIDKVVLIIEDDVQFAQILLSFVRERGYKGIMAHQGNIGLSLARHYQPDAMILDMMLPVMDGTEVLKRLKTDPKLRHIPVQIISGYDKRKEGIELGAFDFIKKPLSQQDLSTSFLRVEEFINKKLKKLLVVEDNRQQNQAIIQLIGNGDVRSFPAFSGEEARQILDRENIDCIIIDLGLPDMSGFELMEKIKSTDSLKKTPIIVYTAKDLNREETHKLNKLANTVVLKTVDSHERLLDETSLFLHRVEAKLPQEKQEIIRKLHRTDEILQNKKALIVDDDIRNIFSLSNALEEEGLQCISAENGKEALNMLNEHPDIDVILMDVMMPEMDGYEATAEIRKSKQYDQIPIIALTAKAMKGDREKCLLSGMSDYVSKPVNIQQLVSLLKVWLYK